MRPWPLAAGVLSAAIRGDGPATGGFATDDWRTCCMATPGDAAAARDAAEGAARAPSPRWGETHGCTAPDGSLTLAMCPLPALGDALDDDWLRSLVAYNDGHDHRDEIYRRLAPAFLDRTTNEWIELLDRHGVWCGPVYDYDDLAADPHVRATGTFVEQPHPELGVVRTVRPPIRLSATPTGIERGAPRLGADTASVLADVAGYDPGQIDELVRAGAVRLAEPAVDADLNTTAIPTNDRQRTRGEAMGTIRYDVSDQIATITIDRPDKLERDDASRWTASSTRRAARPRSTTPCAPSC